MIPKPLPTDPAAGLEIVIQPTRGWRWFSWRELYSYRDLLWLMARRDIVARYQQTVLGPLWYIIQPVLTTVIFVVIFSRVARIPTNGVPSSLFYLCGQLPWNYFAQTFQSTSNTFLANASMFGKVYFPRLIVPLAAALSNLVALGIQVATFFVIFALEKTGPRAGTFHLHATAWLLPLALLQVAILSIGIGLWVTALTAKFRDFAVLATFLLQLWMYASPVVFPLTRVPARLYWAAAANPLTFPIEAIRQMLLGAGTPTLPLFFISLGTTLILAVGGALMFRRVERNFIDVI